MASPIWGVQDLVVEDGEVEGETKADGVGRSEFSLGDVGGILMILIRKNKTEGVNENTL